MSERFDTSKIRGELAGLIRTSDSTSSDPESQKSVIEGFARSIGKSISKWFVEPNRRRWQYSESVQRGTLKEVLDAADQGQFQWLIVDKAQRIGTKHERQLFHFLGELEMRSSNLWSVAEGDLMESDPMRSLSLMLGSQGDQRDQRAKAQNVARGMRLNAMEFRFNGGVLPYGYDRICIAPDGTERFRVIEERRTENPEYVRGSKERGQQRWISEYTVVYPGGHREHRFNPPGKGKHERYDFALSVKEDRRHWATEIHKLYASGMTRSGIAAHLNQMGADLGLKSFWCAENITQILAHPIYGGRYQWRRLTKAVYSSIRPDGTYEDVEDRRMGPNRKRRVEADGIIKSSQVREDLRLVDEETLAKVAKRLVEEQTGKVGMKRPRSDSFWLQPFLRCGHCGGPMQGQHNTGEGQPFRHAYFRCSTYRRKLPGGRQCVHNRIRLDALDQLREVFLKAYGQDIDQELQVLALPKLDRLKLEARQRTRSMNRRREEIETFVTEYATEDEQDHLSAGEIELLELYDLCFNRVQDALSQKLEARKAQIRVLIRERIAHAEDSMSRQVIDEEIDEHEQAVRAITKNLVRIDQRLDADERELRETAVTIKAVKAHAKANRTRQASEAIRGMLERIEIFSVENPLKGGSRPDRILDRAIFVTRRDGPIEIPAARPKGSVPPAALERARALWHEGRNLTEIAQVLTAEKHPTARGGSAWNRGTLLKLLRPEIAASGERRDGRQQRRPPSNRAARSAPQPGPSAHSATGTPRPGRGRARSGERSHLK